MRPAVPIPPECPWSGLYALFGEPNVKWCEERLCAWINEPANTWSNLGYILVGLFWLWRARTSHSRIDLRFGWTIVLVGVASFAYHATNNFGTQVFDFLGMYVFEFLLLSLNLRRLGWIRPEKVGPTQVGLTALFTALVPPMNLIHFPFQVVVAVAALAIIATELLIARRPGPRPPLTFFVLGFSLLFLGECISIADLKDLWCDPKDHWFPGHAIWHWLGAGALACTAIHYSRLGLDESPRAPEA